MIFLQNSPDELMFFAVIILLSFVGLYWLYRSQGELLHWGMEHDPEFNWFPIYLITNKHMKNKFFRKWVIRGRLAMLYLAFLAALCYFVFPKLF